MFFIPLNLQMIHAAWCYSQQWHTSPQTVKAETACYTTLLNLGGWLCLAEAASDWQEYLMPPVSKLPRHLPVSFNFESEKGSLDVQNRNEGQETSRGKGRVRWKSVFEKKKFLNDTMIGHSPTRGLIWHLGLLLKMRIWSRWPGTQGCSIHGGTQDSSWLCTAVGLVWGEFLLSSSNLVSQVGCENMLPTLARLQVVSLGWEEVTLIAIPTWS